MKNQSLLIYWLSLALLLFSACAADPWPEPDSAQNNRTESSNDRDNVGGYSDSDEMSATTSTDTDTSDTKDTPSSGTDTMPDVDSGADTEVDSEQSGTEVAIEDEDDSDEITTATDEEHTDDSVADNTEDDDEDAGTGADGSDSGIVAVDRIFSSAPSEDGVVTLVGLPGAVPLGSSVWVNSDGTSEVLKVGTDGGFAGRLNAGNSDSFEMRVLKEDGETAIVPLKLGYPEEKHLEAGVIGSGEGVSAHSESMIEIRGAGAHLTPDTFVVAANLTAATGAMTPTVCTDTICEFYLLLTATQGDEVDLFLVQGSTELNLSGNLFGSVAQTIWVE